jgi:hypothetical protein
MPRCREALRATFAACRDQIERPPLLPLNFSKDT